MGSELLVTLLEIDKGQVPDWAAAEAVLAAMSDEAVRAAYMEALDLNEDAIEERGLELARMRTEMQATLDALRDAWVGVGGDIVRYPGQRTQMLIGGGTSYGEDIEACNKINLFWESGMATAAGFLGAATGPGEQAEDGSERSFSQQELDLLVEEHDVISLILDDPAARARRRDPPVIGVGSHKDLELVTPARLSTYLERRGWTIDEHGSDDIQKSWDGPGGGICYTHVIPVADAEVMAWDVESVAIGEDCSVPRVLVGLLALGPFT